MTPSFRLELLEKHGKRFGEAHVSQRTIGRIADEPEKKNAMEVQRDAV